MINLFVTWNVSPEIVNIFGLSVRWYSLLFACAFIFGYYIFKKYTINDGIDNKKADKILIYMIVGAILGARLGHCLFYEPEYYLKNPIEILKTWNGGLASHGGAIGILIAIYIYSVKSKLNYIWLLDRLVIVTALGGFFIRMGNLFNSEIYGKATNLPWAFKFVRDEQPAIPRHPTQIYEGLFYLLSFIFMHLVFKKYKNNPPRGLMLSLFFILIFGSRIFIEFLKERQVEFEETMTLDMGQWLSIPFVLFGIVYLIVIFNNKPKEQKI